MCLVRTARRGSAPGSRWLAILGVLVIGGCQALPPAMPSGSASPTSGSSLTATIRPSAEPTARPTPTPAQSPRIAVDDVVLALTDELRVRAAPGLDGRAIGTAPRNWLMFVASGPVSADGYAWYFVMPFDVGDAGWVAAASLSGAPWLGTQTLTCPTSPLDGQAVLGLGAFGGLACFGSNEVRLVGDIRCALGDGDLPYTGPDWLAATGTCTFDVLGQTLRVLDGGIPGLGLPMAGRVSVTGHFDDPQADLCRWAVGQPDPDPISVVTSCRALFVATSIDAP